MISHNQVNSPSIRILAVKFWATYCADPNLEKIRGTEYIGGARTIKF